MRSFAYVFETPAGSTYPPFASAGSPRGVPADSGPGGPIEATPFELEHGDISALGFRIGALAYTPDVNGVPDASRPFLEGLESGSSTLCATPRIPRISVSTKRSLGSSGCARGVRF